MCVCARACVQRVCGGVSMCGWVCSVTREDIYIHTFLSVIFYTLCGLLFLMCQGSCMNSMHTFLFYFLTFKQ